MHIPSSPVLYLIHTLASNRGLGQHSSYQYCTTKCLKWCSKINIGYSTRVRQFSDLLTRVKWQNKRDEYYNRFVVLNKRKLPDAYEIEYYNRFVALNKRKLQGANHSIATRCFSLPVTCRSITSQLYVLQSHCSSCGFSSTPCRKACIEYYNAWHPGLSISTLY